jgi:AraC family L-rhamnose operon transcriptional activator RhaR
VEKLTDGDIDEFSDQASRITRSRSFQEVSHREVFVSPTASAYADIRRMRLGPGVGIPHSIDFLQIFVVTEGHGRHLSARGAVTVDVGSLVVLRPGAWTTFTDCDLEFAALGISPSALAVDLAFLRNRPGVRDLLYSSAHTVNGVRRARVDIASAREYSRQVARLRRLLTERPDDLVLVLGQIVTVIGVAVAALDGSSEITPMHPAVEATLERLESEPEHPWRMTDLARAVSLDAKYLTRLFHAEVGVPPLTHLTSIRIERAAALLADRRFSIAQVGAAVGWPDATHFSRRFRALMGISPRTYRNEIRGVLDA